MSLSGIGGVVIWNDILPEARTDFFEWHNREHIPERVGIPGFRRGRRYAALDAQPEFFPLYETDGAAVFTGADYLERLEHPTPWTRRTVASYTNTSRSLCNVTLSLGPGDGGLMMSYRCEVDAEHETAILGMLVEGALPRLAERPGVVGVHVCRADRPASGVQTAEKRVRKEIARVPGWIILVEGGSDAPALQVACDDVLSPASLCSAGATSPVERGLCQLQYDRHANAGSAP